MRYRCIKAFGHLVPGDLVDVDGDVSPEFFEPVTAPEPAAEAAPGKDK